MELGELTGTWRLRSYESWDEAGARTFPYGPDAIGYLIYSQDGYVSVAIAAAERRSYMDGDILGGTLDERADATSTYRSYVARYDLRGDRVIHHFLLSLFPNRVGRSEERLIEYDGDLLTLSTPSILSGGMLQRSRLVWERAQ